MRMPAGSAPLAGVALGLCLWSGWFLAQGSARIAGARAPCVADDALITLAYAKNLDEGLGLDWSRRGDRIEGFTHPLWLLLLAPLVLPDLPRPLLAWAAPLLGLLSLLLLLAIADRFARRVLGLEARERWLALGMVAALYPLAYWGLQGMETALQAALVVAIAGLGIRQLRAGEGGQRALGWAGGIAGLVRPDTLLAWAAVELALAVERRLGTARELLAGLSRLALPLAAWQLFRLFYFGDPLPNTYYLKLEATDLATRLVRGAWASLPFAIAALPLLLLALAARTRCPRAELRLGLLVWAVFPLYGIWLGGDAWEEVVPISANRFQAASLPLLALLAAPALAALAATLRARLSVAALRPAVAPVLAVALAIWINGRPGWSGWREGVARLLVTEPPPQCVAAMHVLDRLIALERELPPTTTVATVWAGTPAFFSSFPLYDLLGFNDRRIAHEPPRAGRSLAEWRQFWPGHVKWDRELALTVDRPGAFFQVPRMWPPDSEQALAAAGYRPWRGFWIREDLLAKH